MDRLGNRRLQGGGIAAVRKIAQFIALLLMGSVACLAQSQPSTAPPQRVKQTSSAMDTGVVPLAYPYSISTAPHFAVLVQFPKADTIRRIALGDSNYFLAEADKDDPHYAIVKQIRSSGVHMKSPVETNMLVYMASGRVVNILLKSGKLEDTAYSIDYVTPNAQPKTDPPLVSTLAAEKTLREQEQAKLAQKMLDEVKKSPKDEEGVLAGGLDLRMYKVEREGALALVSFDIENTSSVVVDLEGPQINLVTLSDKNKDRKKPPTKIEPIELTQSVVTPKQLPPGGRATCLVEFKPPIHDSDQQVVLSVTNRAKADEPATFRIE